MLLLVVDCYTADVRIHNSDLHLLVVIHLVKTWNKNYLLGYCKKIITVKLGQVSLSAWDEIIVIATACCFCSSPLGFTDQKWSRRSVSVFLQSSSRLAETTGRPVPCARVSSALQRDQTNPFLPHNPVCWRTMGSFLFRKPRLWCLLLYLLLLLQALPVCGFRVLCPYWTWGRAVYCCILFVLVQ